ncbi:hypothetical protein M3Y99_00344000 [Aphelenchoides fujianensis]|nr:hypothetical protein M3Y99_00344000 [Aphelenchoides fujianensis]
MKGQSIGNAERKSIPYLQPLQSALETLEDELRESGLPFAQSSSTPTAFDGQSTSNSPADPRVAYAALSSELLLRLSELLRTAGDSDRLLPVSALEDVGRLLSVLKAITVVPSTVVGVDRSTEWTGVLAELWPAFTNKEARDFCRSSCNFADVFVALSSSHPFVNQLVTTRFFADFLVSLEHLKHYECEDLQKYEEFVEQSVPSALLCRQLLQLLQATAAVAKGPNAWLQASIHILLITCFLFNPKWGQTLSLLLASLIEIADNSAAAKATPVQFGHWDSQLDNALWLADLWLQHAAKVKSSRSVQRMDKFFGTCMLIAGQLGELPEEEAKHLRPLASAIRSVLRGLLSAGDFMKTSEFIVDCLLTITRFQVPSFAFSPSAKSLIRVVGEEDKTKRHFDSVRLDIREEKRETSEVIDLFVSSLLALVNEEFKEEKSRFMVNLLAVCLKKWAAFNEQEQWSLSASKWTSTAARNEEAADSGAERLVLEYFMGVFEQLFDSSFENQLDEGLISKLLEISETVAICSELFQLTGRTAALKKPNANPGKKKAAGISELLDVIRADFEDETDGCIQIAERGHAIISVERLLRKRDESLFAEVDGGLTRVFDCLTENLRHFDSYVYLAAINALVELTSWKHAIFLPKMMFLLQNQKADERDSDDEEAEATAKDKITTNARCQAQMGEALAKVAVELGDLAPSYFDQLSRFFLSNVHNEDSTVCASSLSGLASLIVACRGPILHEEHQRDSCVLCCETGVR